MMAGRHWSSVAALTVVAVLAAGGWLAREVDPSGQTGGRATTEQAGPGHGIPPAAERTLHLIQRGGPFPYERDGSVFQNREGRLPAQPRGYYREYTVPTPGARDRGARRIVTGGEPPRVFFYTDDHYQTFRRIEVAR